MKNTFKIAACLLAISVLLATGCTSKQSTLPSDIATEGNQVGDRAFDFQLQNLDGQTISLSAFRGKPVVLNFWRTECDPCRSEMPLLQQVEETRSGKGLIVLEVEILDSSSEVRQFMTDNNISLPTLLDGGDVSELYAITVIPDSYFIDKNGIIRQIMRGAFSSKAAIEDQLKKIMP